MQPVGQQGLVGVLAQDLQDARHVHRVGQLAAEGAQALLVGLHAAEEDVVDRALQVRAQGLDGQRQDEEQQPHHHRVGRANHPARQQGYPGSQQGVPDRDQHGQQPVQHHPAEQKIGLLQAEALHGVAD